MLIEKDLYERIQKITGQDYDAEKVIPTTYERNKEVVYIEGIEMILEDLITDYHRLEEQFEDYKQNVEDNYRQVSKNEQYR